MRKRSFHRSFSRSATKVRTFWVRNTGSTFATWPGNAVAGSILFDPLQYLPDPVTQRADIARDIVVLSQRFNFVGEAFTNGQTGTAKFAVMYCGIQLCDRSSGFRSPAFSGVDDARTDWLDVWQDVAQVGAGIDQITQQTVQFQQREGTMRHIKAKRKMRSEDLMNLSMVIFPVSGTLAGIGGSFVYQWQYSALLRVG